MSAYIVPREHIAALVQFAMSSGDPVFSWYRDVSREEMHCADFERDAEVGQMLWDENVASVKARYPGCNDLPGPVGCDYQYGTHPIHTRVLSPVAILKALDSYEYQTCEHDGWAASSAKAFVEALRSRAIHSLPGYREAAWEITA